MPLPNPQSSAQAQAMLADHVRNPTLPAPEGIEPERLAVYTRLLRNNLKTFLDLCFSDSSTFLPSQQWQDWQNRFLLEARPESPFFNDIPTQFLAYLKNLPSHDQPTANLLAMMDFEIALLHAETTLQPLSPPFWHANSELSWSPTARLQHYPCDFISSDLTQINDNQACHVLTWRNRQDEVYYRIVEDIDLFLLQHFHNQNDTYTNLLNNLQTLLPTQDIENILKNHIHAWVTAGVLLSKL